HSACASPELLPFPTRRSSDLTGASCAMRSPPRPRGGCLATAGVLNVVPGRFDPLAAPGPIPDSAPRARRLRTPGCSERRGWLGLDRKSTRLNSSHLVISYAVF